VIGTSDTPVPAAPWESGGTADAVQLTKWIIDGTNPSEDGYFDTNCELGDICEVASSGALATFNYRGWHVEPYWSNRDRACIQGDNPVSLEEIHPGRRVRQGERPPSVGNIYHQRGFHCVEDVTGPQERFQLTSSHCTSYVGRPRSRNGQSSSSQPSRRTPDWVSTTTR
jgi:hypothetical protein